VPNYVKSNIKKNTDMHVDSRTHLTLWREGIQVDGCLENGRPLSCYSIMQWDTIKIRKRACPQAKFLDSDEGWEMPTEQSKNMSIQDSDGSKIDESHVQ
jgi:hypothetical protein